MPRCENGRASYLGHVICSPACLSADADQRVTITYNELEEDVLYLCSGCAEVISRDARRHAYKVSRRALLAGGA